MFVITEKAPTRAFSWLKAVVAAFNQEKALVGAYSVITNLRMELFQALPPDLQCCSRHLIKPVHCTAVLSSVQQASENRENH